MNSIKLIIFDLDGTLVDAYHGVASSLNFTMDQLGLEAIEHDRIKRSVGWGDRHLLATFIEESDLDKAVSIFRQHHARALKEGTVYLPGAKTLLKQLKAQGYIMAIATNRPTRFTHIILKHLGMTDYFDTVLCGDKVKRAKPAPDILHQVLAKFTLESDQALYVGDMTVDIEAGQAAGVKTVAVTTGSCDLSELEALDPHQIIDNVAQVAEIIEDLNKLPK